jgi:hexosaminidase
LKGKTIMLDHRSAQSVAFGLALSMGLLGITTGTTPAQAASQELAATTASAAGPTPSDAGVPTTVPALQEWKAGGRDFTLKPGAILVRVEPADAGTLGPDANTFATDLRALTGQPVVVQVKDEGPGVGPGVIHMGIDPSWTQHGDESYRVVVDGDVTIAGPTDAGVFAGTRTLLQLLRQSNRIPGGLAQDWPGYPERSLMIDNGRKYITPAWAKREIRELSYLKYNQFHWHIADNSGFRIESDTHPEVVSAEHWTKQDVRDLVAYAAKYHVEVIPEIDMPGHMQQALRTHPELQIVDGDGVRNANNLDPTKPAARQFVKDILHELIPLFPGRYVHTGGDEFTSDWDRYPVLTEWAQAKYGPDANSHDAVLDFTNYLDGIVRSHGKVMRIWNDGGQGGSQVQANRDIVLEYWSSQHGGVLAQQFLDQGFKITNANRNVLYDVPGATPTWNNLDPRKITDSWAMTQWHDWIGPNTTAPRAPGVLGGQLHLWNDTPTAATEEQEAGRLQMPLRAMSQKLWDSPVDGGWDTLAASAFAASHEPQWALLDGPNQNLALGALAWSSARERPDCHESMLVDGDDTTRWCGPKTGPQSVVVDLGRATDLGTVVLKWESAFASGYTVDLSNDLRTWTTAHATSSGDGKLDVLPVSGHARYLRLSMSERGTKYGYSLYEVQAYPRGALVPAQFAADMNPDTVLLQPGAAATSTLTVTNSSSRDTEVRWSAKPPPGVTVSPASGTLQVPAEGTASTQVHVSGSATPGSVTIPVSVTGQSLDEAVQLASAELLASVPYSQLSAAYNNVSVTTDEDVNPPTLGPGVDGAGSSYSAQALAGAGVVPGAELTSGGVAVHWPEVPVAQPNNVVANGQSVVLSGSGSEIGLLVAATYGPATGDWVVHYTDGSSTTIRLSTPDWSSTPPAGSTVVATMSYRNNTATGQTTRGTQVFYQRIQADPDKSLAAITLPTVSEEVLRGKPALHVFDVAVGTP